jgi:hypothetical protein
MINTVMNTDLLLVDSMEERKETEVGDKAEASALPCHLYCQS